MPLDAITLDALCIELKAAILGAKIEKIHQPVRDELLLSLRGRGPALRLLLSANPSRGRIQLTERERENPAQPPMFCMLLRKHLSGGRIVDIRQPPMERLVELSIEASDELGERSVKRLVLELMGRRTNLLLVDAQDYIVDCLRRVDYEMSSERQLLPGMIYRLPEQKKMNILADLESSASLPVPKEEPMERHLLDNYAGISPLIAREIAFEVAGESQALFETEHAAALRLRLERLAESIREGRRAPYLLLRGGAPFDFSFRPILQYGPEVSSEQQESFSALLDRFHGTREKQEQMRQKGQELNRVLRTARDRIERKLGHQRRELLETAGREGLREKGELITANLYRMEKGMASLIAENLYDPQGGEIRIPLDPLKTPQQNAARYYKDYHRMKTAERVLGEQIQKNETELDYVNSVLESLSRAEGAADLEEIRQELTEQRYLRQREKRNMKKKRSAGLPLEFFSSTGLRISVGRTNTQNDQLTMKQAGKLDLWFHTQKIHGAHVILWCEGREADEQSKQEAAQLAAFYSQAAEGAKVPVDHTFVKHVKKPNGAKPGMVTYTHYETSMIVPQEAAVMQLARNKKSYV